jgi:ribose transport system permease protein
VTTEAANSARRSVAIGPLLQRLSVPIVWLITIAVFGALRPDSFLTVSTFSSILGSDAVLVFLTLGLLLTLRAGDYDLSAAAVLTMSSMLVAILNVNEGWPIGLCIIAAVAAGMLVGLFNGLVSVLLDIDSFIVTLGVGSFISGIVLWISSSNTVSGVSNDLIDWVVGKTFLSVPLEFYYALALCLILFYAFEFTGVGQRHLFVGKGREVARLSGIPVARVRIWSFVLTGMVSAMAGVLYVGTAGGADPSSGLTYLLPAFAAAFLGSTTILPGQFNPIGAFVSAYFLVTGITGLQIIGVQNFVTDLFYGGALVIAVAATQLVKKDVLGRARRARRRPVPVGGGDTDAGVPGSSDPAPVA